MGISKILFSFPYWPNGRVLLEEMLACVLVVLRVVVTRGNELEKLISSVVMYKVKSGL